MVQWEALTGLLWKEKLLVFNIIKKGLRRFKVQVVWYIWRRLDRQRRLEGIENRMSFKSLKYFWNQNFLSLICRTYDILTLHKPNKQCHPKCFSYILKNVIDVTWHEIKFRVFVRWRDFHKLLRSATDVEENRIWECLKRIWR